MPEDEEQLQHPTNGDGTAIGFNLPESLIAVLPSDPFEQLDLARKITSIALATRLAKLEDEIDGLSRTVSDRDDLIAKLRAHIESLDSTLGELSGQLNRTQEEKETLLKENATLSDTVKKLNRDVSKLEVFKKTLMQSLKEEDESSQVGSSRMAQMQISNVSSSPSRSHLGEEDSSNPPPKSFSTSETGYGISNDGDYSDVYGKHALFLELRVQVTFSYALPVVVTKFAASKHGALRGFDLPSHGGTPRLTPPGSPPKITVGLTSKRLSRPISPRRHSISVTSTRNMVDDRSGMFSSMPATQHSSITSPFDTGAQTGRTRVDGKEFFRQVRNRLSSEQFSAFLANVKELNSHNQTRGETLRKADEIFGPDNKDLYTIFEGLITRNLH
ncbi:hypothetical protein IEQ34_000866 [Dendrobium chrysotoxum]|uniref:At4g15545-like C-terminal domain-containing protein n=1 Tax=Dendrobium chrysotoxum TaxID=161865 RepID=A0AAV7HUS4_DENCH|nr:hypothetical protein IEQ34_000866 [Dendrobium chrysotoxum]